MTYSHTCVDRPHLPCIACGTHHCAVCLTEDSVHKCDKCNLMICLSCSSKDFGLVKCTKCQPKGVAVHG